MKHQTRFVSQKPAKVVLSSMEVVAQSMGFKTHIRNFKVSFWCLSVVLLHFHLTVPFPLSSSFWFCFFQNYSSMIMYTYILYPDLLYNVMQLLPSTYKLKFHQISDESGRSFSKQDVSFLCYSGSKLHMYLRIPLIPLKFWSTESLFLTVVEDFWSSSRIFYGRHSESGWRCYWIS